MAGSMTDGPTMMPLSRTFTTRLGALCCAVLLAGCGGSDNEGVFVTSMTASPTAYSRTMTLTLAGSGLDQGVRVQVDSGCGEVTESAGGDRTTRRFTCSVNALGKHTARAFAANGNEVARVQFTVPEPEVTFTISGVGTSLSTFVVKLDPVRAPLSVNNFLAYVNAGFYRNVIFHRVVKDFVIQAGGFTAGPTPKAPTNPPIKLESNNGLLNTRGTIAMARTDAADSATAQFYINTVDNPSLDYKSEAEPGYAVFGEVITGLFEVVDQIEAAPVTLNVANRLTHLPRSNITIVLASQTK